MLMRASQHGGVVMVFDPVPGHLLPLTSALSRRGFRIISVDNAAALDGRQMFDDAASNVDLLLARLSGTIRQRLDLVRRLRSHCDLPIVVCSERGETAAERIAALELGADEYLLFTMSQPEMVARVQSVLRRASRGSAGGRSPSPLSSLVAAPQVAPVMLPGGWQLAPQRRALTSSDAKRSIRLTSAEYDLLRLLAAANGNPIDRDAISLAVFRRPWRVGDRAVDSLVKRLRQKCLTDAIATVRGCGYALLIEQREAAISRA
jgi:DNA-binding response OmpR family regulator